MKYRKIPLLLLCFCLTGCQMAEKVIARIEERIEERQSQKQKEKEEKDTIQNRQNKTDKQDSSKEQDPAAENKESEPEPALSQPSKTQAPEPESSEPEVSYTYTIVEKNVSNWGQKMAGVLFMPDKQGPLDLVIISHGLTGNYLSLQRFGEDLARAGYAAYCLEFRCSGYNSEGNPFEMTIGSEVSDLEAVLAASQSWGFEIDQTFLLGQSHGGLVSGIEAGRNPDIDGVILLAPAFNLPGLIHKLVNSLEEAPEYLNWEWLQLGFPYLQAVWNYDPYSDVEKYAGPVLILQGDADVIVPADTAYELSQHCQNDTLRIMEGADHSFAGESYPQALSYILDFLQTVQ